MQPIKHSGHHEHAGAGEYSEGASALDLVLFRTVVKQGSLFLSYISYIYL